MILLVALVLPLWLALLVAVSGLCRAAQAGDEAVASDGCAERARRGSGSRDAVAHRERGGAGPSAACVGGRAPNLFVGSGERKNFSAAA